MWPLQAAGVVAWGCVDRVWDHQRACMAAACTPELCWSLASMITQFAAILNLCMQMEVDLQRRHDLDIHVDITFHSVPCAGEQQ